MTRDEKAEGARPAELLARLIGTTPEEMRTRPEVAKEKLSAVFRELAQLKAGGGPHRLDATRELMRRIRVGLQASGEPVPDELDELPERLAGLSERLGEATPDELADFLRGLASLVGSGPRGEEGGQLEEVVAWFEKNVGPLVGLERERRRQDAELQAEYREAAKRSIDASLRRHGIQPLTTDPEPTRTRPAGRMNRQRLFWKEFAAEAERIKDLLSRGEGEAAKRAVEELLDSYDLDFSVRLSLEGGDAVLAFEPPDDIQAATRLQLVIRDSPTLPGWRFVRARRYGGGGDS